MKIAINNDKALIFQSLSKRKGSLRRPGAL